MSQVNSALSCLEKILQGILRVRLSGFSNSEVRAELVPTFSFQGEGGEEGVRITGCGSSRKPWHPPHPRRVPECGSPPPSGFFLEKHLGHLQRFPTAGRTWQKRPGTELSPSEAGTARRQHCVRRTPGFPGGRDRVLRDAIQCDSYPEKIK